MKVLSFFSIKGGVAKSVSSMAFAQILHDDYGKRILLVDIDKQANTSKTFGCYTPDGFTSADLLTAKSLIADKAIRHSDYGIRVAFKMISYNCVQTFYRFSFYKVKDVCIEILGHVVTLPKNRNTKLLVTTAAKKVTSFRGQLALLKDEMISIAKPLSA